MPKKTCPEFKGKLKQENVTIISGGTASLLCEVDHDRHRNARYFDFEVKSNNESGITKNKNIFHRTSEGIEKTLLNYTIVNATKDDSGKYECVYLHADEINCPQNFDKIFDVKGMVSVHL